MTVMREGGGRREEGGGRREEGAIARCSPALPPFISKKQTVSPNHVTTLPLISPLRRSSPSRSSSTAPRRSASACCETASPGPDPRWAPAPRSDQAP
eukprot:755607-Hanusia_phi.AAC.1